MKLKNKKTGEVVELESLQFDTVDRTYEFNNIDELEREWEDYEEPKEYYFIRDDGSGVWYSPIGNSTVAKRREEIGNYFDTREEAEKAVEKLKAWKRLKDKGFKFKCCDDYHIDYELTGKCAWTDETEADLDLLFGDEE